MESIYEIHTKIYTIYTKWLIEKATLRKVPFRGRFASPRRVFWIVSAFFSQPSCVYCIYFVYIVYISYTDAIPQPRFQPPWY